MQYNITSEHHYNTRAFYYFVKRPERFRNIFFFLSYAYWQLQICSN